MPRRVSNPGSPSAAIVRTRSARYGKPSFISALERRPRRTRTSPKCCRVWANSIARRLHGLRTGRSYPATDCRVRSGIVTIQGTSRRRSSRRTRPRERRATGSSGFWPPRASGKQLGAALIAGAGALTGILTAANKKRFSVHTCQSVKFAAIDQRRTRASPLYNLPSNRGTRNGLHTGRGATEALPGRPRQGRASREHSTASAQRRTWREIKFLLPSQPHQQLQGCLSIQATLAPRRVHALVSGV
jgi:hypothetical protein